MYSHQQSSGTILPRIVISAGDYERLIELTSTAARTSPQVSDYLVRELCRAHVVPAPDMDVRVARVGSRVIYRDDQTGRQRAVTLAWPQEADIGRSRISVLTSIGAALLGMLPGQSIDWPAPIGGPRTLTVVDVDNGGPRAA